MSPARVTIGVPMFNHAHKLREALDSILAQSFGAIGVVLVDDCSTDETREIAEAYARLDPRVRYHCNARRLGMIDNWRAAFALAHEAWPEADYFAWGSDHDLWHPSWVEHLVAELDAHPDAVLAYPLNLRVDGEGRVLPRKPWEFTTAGVAGRVRRFVTTVRNMSAGNMIYGLFRVSSLMRAGVFRHVLVPDRLLLAELSVFGEFRQVPRVLWFRRWYGRLFSIGRQRQAFFPDGRPAYAYLPWWISHTASLATNLSMKGTGWPEVGRAGGAGFAALYFGTALPLHIWQQVREKRYQLLERASGLRPYERKVRLLGRAAWRRANAQWVMKRMKKVIAPNKRRRSAARLLKRARRLPADMVRVPGAAFLRGLRSVPIVRNRVIPWFVRQELQQLPTGPVVEAMRGEMDRLRKGSAPLVVGPWLSEVGFELLYWIPWLNWAVSEFGLSPDRLVVVSRGGAARWYRHLTSRSLDLFDLFSIDEYRQRNEERWARGGNQKHYEIGQLDLEILERVRQSLGAPDAELLHPSLMYRLLRYYWFEKAPIGLLHKHTIYRALERPEPLDGSAGLPADYVAVRFYFRPSFPDSPENRAFATTVVRTLARQYPVVLLNHGFRFDDHDDLDVSTGMGVYRADRLMTPSTNLEVQSRIIAGARALVGTYGGLSYLGPCYGVPTIGLYSDPSQLVATHVDVGWRLSMALGTPLATLSVKDTALVRLIADGAFVASVGAGAPSTGPVSLTHIPA